MNRKSKFANANINDSDASGETNSLSAESTTENVSHPVNKKRAICRRESEWEVLEGLKEGQRFDKNLEVFSGFLHKKRKWPLKGWHKRFFVLEKGILMYGKTLQDIKRGKRHGTVDVGLSVISSKLNGHRIDIDAEEFIFHLKAKTDETFFKWLLELKDHRLYRQHTLTYGTKLGLLTCNDDSSRKSTCSKLKTKLNDDSTISEKSFGTLFDSLKNSHFSLEEIQNNIANSEKKITQLFCVLDKAECYEKEGRRFSNNEKHPGVSFCTDEDLAAGSSECESLSIHHLYKKFSDLAKEVLFELKDILHTLTKEKGLITTTITEENVISQLHCNINLIADLKNSLRGAFLENGELKRRLKCIHATSDSANLSRLNNAALEFERRSNSSLSCDSSCISASEFFDAEDLPEDDQEKTEVLVADNITQISAKTSDTSSEAGSFSTNDSSSESEMDEYTCPNNKIQIEAGHGFTGRRTVLPSPRPNTEGLSLWNLLYKNIGKDLSQISMPVALNEPLNVLQRLCEELEYSELLDKASELEDPYERMVYVAAFAVSAYASSYSRAGNKPFNPLLGETYECIREDKGFRFLAEQVSHHPPVSACHVESKNFVFWQEARVKTKFWGKSMEFQPLGKINLLLPQTGDTYSWNKVTTCVHSLFSSSRWVDQYGELHITNEHVSCKLTFVKTNYWSSKRHEVYGTIYNKDGKSVRKLFGRWSEALYCGIAPSAKCIWRAGTLPANHEQYYGFTRFAIELNELGPDSNLLPPTDTRFRPDQHALECGNLIKAEQLKLQLENIQRERRKQRIAQNVQYNPKWFNCKVLALENEEWQYNGKYWEVRKNLGFASLSLESLW